MSNLSIRIISALVILPPILLLIFFGKPIYFTGISILFAVLAGYEFGNMSMGKSYPKLRYFVGFLSAIVCSAVTFYHIYPKISLALLALTAPIAFIGFMFSKHENQLNGVNSMAYSVFGSMYCGGLFGLMSLIVSSTPNGNYWFLLLLAATVLNDTLAYTFGRIFGKRKLYPSLSPNKTWAGALGGVVGSILAVTLCKLLFISSIGWVMVPLLGGLVSVFCQIGDLAESFIKRGFGVKDSGTIIPGHGGILDRCDALMFGAPVVLYFSVLLQ